MSSDVKNDLSSFVSQELSKSDRPELTSADTVISGGEIRIDSFVGIREAQDGW